jgi:hypothetical protein
MKRPGASPADGPQTEVKPDGGVEVTDDSALNAGFTMVEEGQPLLASGGGITSRSDARSVANGVLGTWHATCS